MIVVGFSVRGAVESLRKLNIDRIIAIDFFGDWDLFKLSSEVKLVRSLEDLRNSLLSYPKEKIIYTSILENNPNILRLVEDRIIGNGTSSVKLVRPVKRGWEFACELRIRIPRVSERLVKDGKWLLKPYKSGGGRNISFWREGESVKRGYYLQEFIEGESISFLFLADGKDFIPLGYTKQLIGFRELGGNNFKWCGNIYPYNIEKSFRDEIENWVGQLVKKAALKGLNGIDIVLSENGPYFIEVNPRYTASMELLEKAHNINILGVHIQACEGEMPSVKFEDFRGFYAKGIVYAEKTLKGFKCEEMWERGFKDIPRGEEVVTKGRPVCSIFSYGLTEEEVLKKLLEEKRWLYERGVNG